MGAVFRFGILLLEFLNKFEKFDLWVHESRAVQKMGGFRENIKFIVVKKSKLIDLPYPLLILRTRTKPLPLSSLLSSKSFESFIRRHKYKFIKSSKKQNRPTSNWLPYNYFKLKPDDKKKSLGK